MKRWYGIFWFPCCLPLSLTCTHQHLNKVYLLYDKRLSHVEEITETAISQVGHKMALLKTSALTFSLAELQISMPATLLKENVLTDASPAKTLTSCWNNFDHQPLSLVSTLIFGWKLNMSRHMFYRLVLTLKWGCLLYLNVWLLRFYYHYKLSTIIL